MRMLLFLAFTIYIIGVPIMTLWLTVNDINEYGFASDKDIGRNLIFGVFWPATCVTVLLFYLTEALIKVIRKLAEKFSKKDTIS